MLNISVAKGLGLRAITIDTVSPIVALQIVTEPFNPGIQVMQ
jgi:hypothetical protein